MMSVLERIPHFIDVNQAPKFLQVPGLETTILTGLQGEQMMMVLNATLPGYTVPLHSHAHEQIGMVHSGKARLRIGDEERIAQKGDFYCIPANVAHSDTCIGDEPFVMLDVFHPVREDFIATVREASEEQVQAKNDVGVRQAQPSEAPAIHEVMERAFKGLQGRGYSQRAAEAAILSPDAIQARIARDDAHVFVAVSEGQIVGTARAQRSMKVYTFVRSPLILLVSGAVSEAA